MAVKQPTECPDEEVFVDPYGWWWIDVMLDDGSIVPRCIGREQPKEKDPRLQARARKAISARWAKERAK
jgi:hypothetical protein